jgi:alpha-ketoglutarate-dependent taurine dioxygenase
MQTYTANDLITKDLLPQSQDGTFPLLIRPASAATDLGSWMRDNKQEFEKDLVKHGGILFRGFHIETPADFHALMQCFDTAPLPYMFRSSPREELDKSLKNIYLSTTYPRNRIIRMHNESSYSRVWGKKIVFCCIKCAEQGGETPIADSRRVLRDINPELVNKFRSKGVKYRRNLLTEIGMPWQEVFQTTDINEVKAICERNRIDYRWISEENLIIEWVKPAIYRHPVSKEEVWFNHSYFFNKFSQYEDLGLDPAERIPNEYLVSDTFFGDGTGIDYQEYLEIKNAFQKNMVTFPYKNGDVLFLDNMLASHGRTTYKGDRIIATAIIEAASDEDLMNF